MMQMQGCLELELVVDYINEALLPGIDLSTTSSSY